MGVIDKAPTELSKIRHIAVVAGSAMMIVCVTLTGTGLSINMSAILGRFNATGLIGVTALLGVLFMAIGSQVGASLAAGIGIRKIAVVSAALLAAVSVVLAISVQSSLILFVVVRSLQGFATGMITGGIYPIASYIYAPKDSGKGYGIFTGAIALGGVLGGTIGGYLADRSMITVSIIYPSVICVLGAIPIFLFFPGTEGQMEEKHSKRKMDFTGLALLILVLSFLLFPLNFYKTFGITNPFIILSFILFFVFAVLLYKYEKRQDKPIIPFHLLRSKGFGAVCLIGFMGTGIFTTLQGNYLPILSQSVLGVSSAVSGLVTLPKTIITVILPTLLAAWLARGKERHWILLFTQGLLITIPCVILAFNTTTSASFVLLVAMVGVTGIAESCKGAVMNNYAQSQLPLSDVPQGIALLGLVSTCGSAVASAVFGMQLGFWTPIALIPQEVSVYLNQEQLAALSQSGSYMTSSTVVEEIYSTLPQGITGVFDTTIQAIRNALGYSIGSMLIVCAVCGVVTQIIALLVIRRRKQYVRESDEVN